MVSAKLTVKLFKSDLNKTVKSIIENFLPG